jgi:NAD+ synthase
MAVPKMEMRYADVERRIEDAIKDYAAGSGVRMSVIGISGGLDSSVVAYLTARALGHERVIGVTMNDSATPQADLDDQKKVIKNLGIRDLNLEMGPVFSDFYGMLKAEMLSKMVKDEPYAFGDPRLARANIKPRLRMTSLYYFANRLNGFVMGTGDKSEIMLGYYTKYGDGGVDLLPIGDLYKTQVRKLGEHMGVPESVIKKKSSPCLWKDQTAEGEIGMSYETIDGILMALESGCKEEMLYTEMGFSKGDVEKVKDRIRRSEHKRKMPEIIRLNI